MEAWDKNEWFWNSYLKHNKSKWKIISVGQIESWIKTENGEYHFFEVKTQEPFVPPPFHGHGLPRWQINKYIQMQVDLDIVWHLVIFDTISMKGYNQRLSILEDGNIHDTRGLKPRRVYPLESFEVWTDNWKELENETSS